MCTKQKERDYRKVCDVVARSYRLHAVSPDKIQNTFTEFTSLKHYMQKFYVTKRKIFCAKIVSEEEKILKKWHKKTVECNLTFFCVEKTIQSFQKFVLTIERKNYRLIFIKKNSSMYEILNNGKKSVQKPSFEIGDVLTFFI